MQYGLAVPLVYAFTFGYGKYEKIAVKKGQMMSLSTLTQLQADNNEILKTFFFSLSLN